MSKPRLPWYWLIPLVLIPVAACDSNDDDDDTEATTTTTNDDDSTPLPDDDDTTGTTDDDDCPRGHLTETACPELINPVGDLSCLGQNPDPEPGEGTVMVSGVVRDFQAEVPVGGALLEVYGMEFTATSAPDGTFSLEVPARQRINIRASALGYKVTWQYDVLTDAGNVAYNWVLVSKATYSVINWRTWGGPTPDPATCVIAGQVSDCQALPLEGYGVTVVTEACSHPQSYLKWFKGGFPNGTQCPASDDGLWGILNVNPPLATVQVIGASGEILLGSSPLPCEPGALGVVYMQIH